MTIGELHQDVLALRDFLDGQADGSDLGYLAIQQATGIRMDIAGRQRLRSALKQARREYSCIRGFGIKLASPDSVMPILSSRISRIDRAVKRADRTQRVLQEQFFTSLSEQDQKRILFAGAVFGAIRLAADQGKQLQRKKEQLAPTSISIPLPRI